MSNFFSAFQKKTGHVFKNVSRRVMNYCTGTLLHVKSVPELPTIHDVIKVTDPFEALLVNVCNTYL